MCGRCASVLEVREITAQNDFIHSIILDKETTIALGDGTDLDVLRSAGLMDMDTFITATGDNETNILSSLMAKRLMETGNGNSHGNLTKTIALCTKEQYMVLAATSGSDIIYLTI